MAPSATSLAITNKTKRNAEKRNFLTGNKLQTDQNADKGEVTAYVAFVTADCAQVFIYSLFK